MKTGAKRFRGANCRMRGREQKAQGDEFRDDLGQVHRAAGPIESICQTVHVSLSLGELGSTFALW